MAGKRKHPGGRPTELTPDVQRKIVRAIADGATRAHAAQSAGVVEKTFYEWMKRGRREPKGKFREFCKAVALAEGKLAVKNIKLIQKAAHERNEVTVKETVLPDGTIKKETTTRRVFDWGAAAWWLERRFPDDYAANRKKDIEEAVAKALEKVFSNGGGQSIDAARNPPPTEAASPAASATPIAQPSPPRPDPPDADGGDGPGPVAGSLDPV